MFVILSGKSNGQLMYCMCVRYADTRAGSHFEDVTWSIFDIWLNRDVFEHLYMRPVRVCVNTIPGMCVCVWVPHTLGKAAGARCVFQRGSRVGFGPQSSDPHSYMCNPIFNLNSVVTFHHLYGTYTPTEQTGRWIAQRSYGHKRVSV